jgi:hypothetical protein
MSTEDKTQFILDCTEFLYVYSPKNTEADARYVFKDARFDGPNKLDDAYEYAVQLHEDKLLKRIEEFFKEEYGSHRVKEVRDISWVYGPNVHSRHVRVTIEDHEGTEIVADYKVELDKDWQVTTCEEYNRVI